MRISAPIQSQGPPNLEKCEACYKQHTHNFFPFFGLCTPFLKYYLRAKFWTGALLPSRDMVKNGSDAMRTVCNAYMRQDTGQAAEPPCSC